MFCVKSLDIFCDIASISVHRNSFGTGIGLDREFAAIIHNCFSVEINGKFALMVNTKYWSSL